MPFKPFCPPTFIDFKMVADKNEKINKQEGPARGSSDKVRADHEPIFAQISQNIEALFHSS